MIHSFQSTTGCNWLVVCWNPVWSILHWGPPLLILLRLELVLMESPNYTCKPPENVRVILAVLTESPNYTCKPPKTSGWTRLVFRRGKEGSWVFNAQLTMTVISGRLLDGRDDYTVRLQWQNLYPSDWNWKQWGSSSVLLYVSPQRP